MGNGAFVHARLSRPESGTAGADVPGGSGLSLWHSFETTLELPDETLLFCGHDYQPGQRAPAWRSTVAGQKADNIHLRAFPSESPFVSFRTARDARLPLPRLMLHALQLNLNGGRLPPPEANGRRYLKMPIGASENVAWEESPTPSETYG